VCNKFPFVPLNVWSFNLHQKQNSVTASLYFAVLFGRFAIDFPLCLYLVVALQFQVKQFLNLCRFALFASAIDFFLLGVCLCQFQA